MISIISALIMYFMSSAPNRELYKNEEKVTDMASMFVSSGLRYGVDPKILTTWSFSESSFRSSAIGNIPNGNGDILHEQGLFQVHGVAKEICELEHDLGSVSGQIDCGAMLIDMGRRRCGSLERGLWWFASGRCNGTPRARRKTKYRMHILKEAMKEITK